MSIDQRIVGWLQVLREYSPLATIVALLVLPLSLLPSSVNDTAALLTCDERSALTVSFLAALVSHEFNDYIVFGPIDIPNLLHCDVWCSPCKSGRDFSGRALVAELTLSIADYAARCLYSLLPSGFYEVVFLPTNAVKSSEERSPSRRLRLPWRLFHPCIAYNAVYMAFATACLVIRYRSLAQDGKGGGSLCALSFPMVGAISAQIQAIWKCLVPVRYMIWPPDMPERRDLLRKDEDGAWRPTDCAKRSGRPMMAWVWVVFVGLALWFSSSRSALDSAWGSAIETFKIEQ